MEGPKRTTVESMVRGALEEDSVREDVTVSYLGVGTGTIRAEIAANRAGVIAGIDIAREVFRQVDDSTVFDAIVEDGGRCSGGDVLCRVSGPARAVLGAERAALNFMQHLSGVATLAAEFVARVAHSGVTILDTRKTTPLWRELEKYAVRCGGARNHRPDLRAMVLVKENHIRAIGGPEALVGRLRESSRRRRRFVEVEVDSLAILDLVLGVPLDRVMLDNFAPDEVRAGLERIEAYRKAHPDYRVEVEVSGGVTLENVDSYALPGVDYISVGAITHSAPALPMSMEVL